MLVTDRRKKGRPLPALNRNAVGLRVISIDEHFFEESAASSDVQGSRWRTADVDEC